MKKRKKINGDFGTSKKFVKKIHETNNKNRFLVISALIAILILSFILNYTALDWGQTGDVSWSPDAIDGRITAIYMPYLFNQWVHKYPRGQYLVSAIFYIPIIKNTPHQSRTIQLPDGSFAQIPMDQNLFYDLATISRKISVFMSMGILLAVFFTARKLFEDDLAALLSCLTLALSCLFVFYGKSACVDVPAFFWFALAGCFGLYAVNSNRLAFYLLAAFCAAWSVCTKEGVAAFNLGLAVALAIIKIKIETQNGKNFKKALLSLFHWKILSAIALAVLVFVTLEGMWKGFDEWHYRTSHWANVISNEFQPQYITFFTLIKQASSSLFDGWGIPFVALLAISFVYCLFKYRWKLLLLTLPFLAFFFAAFKIGLIIPRFIMPAYAGIAILIGKLVADWYRFKRVPPIVRQILPLLVFVPSFICCLCFDLEMKNDTRVRAENWMASFAKPSAVVGMSMHKQYAPRLWLQGFRSIPLWDSNGIDTEKGKMVIWPDYLIGADQPNYASKTDQDFFNRMFDGKTNYKQQAKFQLLYFSPQSSLYKYCLRFFNLHEGISPNIMIYKKQ